MIPEETKEIQQHINALEYLLWRPAAGLTIEEERAVGWALQAGLQRLEELAAGRWITATDLAERRDIADAQGH